MFLTEDPKPFIYIQETQFTKEDLAAIKIQSFYRGYCGRKIYLELLWQQYEQVK